MRTIYIDISFKKGTQLDTFNFTVGGVAIVRPKSKDRSLASPRRSVVRCKPSMNVSELLINYALSAHSKRHVFAHLLLLAV